MLKHQDSPSIGMEALAEREMAAFLTAASEVAGQRSMRRAGDAWLHAMESLECPDENHEKFFRRVTIKAISQLLTASGKAVRDEKPEPARAANLLAVSRTAA